MQEQLVNLTKKEEKKEAEIKNKEAQKTKIVDSFFEQIILLAAFTSAAIIVIIYIFIIQKSWHVFSVNGFRALIESGFDKQIFHSFNKTKDVDVWKFGFLGLIAGSFCTTIGSLIITTPVGIGAAIAICELSPKRLRSTLMTFVRYLASVPSVIYGLIGLMAVIPFIRLFITEDLQNRYIDRFQITGKSMLAGIIVLSVMIMPLITSLTIDALRSISLTYKEASLALGLSNWRTIKRVLLPLSKSGIITGVILATGTAIGEAIAMSMVIGGKGNIPNPADGFVGFLTPVLTLASAIINKSETLTSESTSSALFACGVILMIACSALSIASKVVHHIMNRRLNGDG